MPQSSDKTADLLTSPVQFIKGVGPQRAELLAKLRLRTVRDVLFFFPRDYQDLTDVRSVDEFEEDTLLSVHGMVEEVELRNTGPGRSMLGVLVRQENYYLRALWWNQPFMRDKFAIGQRVLLSGKAALHGGRWQMTHPRVQFLEPGQEQPEGKLLPVYPLTLGLNQGQVRHVVRTVLDRYLDAVDEVFPAQFLEEHRLCAIKEALPQIHFPVSRQTLHQARRRFVYQELLVLQLALALRRQQYSASRAPALESTAKIQARIERLLPFELTTGQRQAWSEVSADMGRGFPMNRLLQGDVGSGKTIVAVCAMLLAVAHGYQAALMAPTEILAHQHARTLATLLEHATVRIGVLTGSLTGSARQKMLDSISRGEIDLVVGTQAIVHAEAQFAKLGLVVIDEQHKFGVRQRASLKQAGVDPHYLVMTATPIPRTVAMTQFGDLDISTISDSPPGRQTVHTYLPTPEERPKWWDFFRRKLREGRQGYVVVPLIEGSDQVAAASLDETYEDLVHGELEAFRVDLVHGRLSSPEKEAAMDAFRRGQTQVLVATSVVEVGVDIPNATIMTILDAQRFGLAQLHQLRGRICRGTHPGYCCLFADQQSEDAERRLQALLESTDGFRLAELDFELRGPGDLLGTRQHGLPPLRIADLTRDADILSEARGDARALVESDPRLSQPEHERLRRMVIARYGRALALGDVG